MKAKKRKFDEFQNKWSVMNIWNKSLQLERYPQKKRDYVSATDIGKPFLDRYYKMKGVKITNPFEDRVLRVFSAGNQFHWLIGRVFERIGILIDAEQYVEIPATNKRLKVLGYYDIKAGGITDWNEARKRVKNYGFSDAVELRALKLIDYFEKEYPKGLESLIYELKSVNSRAFWSFQEGRGYLKEAYPHHRMQLYTYLKALKIPEGRILMISKDDLTLAEFSVKYPDKELERLWQNDVRKMSKYYLEDKKPPREADIVFDLESKKFKSNWRVERSSYLTLITGKKKDKWMRDTKGMVRKMNIELKKSTRMAVIMKWNKGGLEK